MTSQFRGSLEYPLSQRLADTAREHGVRWAAEHARRNGLTLQECLMLARVPGGMIRITAEDRLRSVMRADLRTHAAKIAEMVNVYPA